MNNEMTYTIQEVSTKTDLARSTLRYYETVGLLEPIDRGQNGHRAYTEADLRRIILIKRLRLTGMSIEAMCEFIALYRGGVATAKKRREILEAHRATVQARVDELVEMIEFIDYKISLYQDEELTYEQQHDEVSVTR